MICIIASYIAWGQIVIENIWSVGSTVQSQLVSFAKFLSHSYEAFIMTILWQFVAIVLVLTNVKLFCWPCMVVISCTLCIEELPPPPPHIVYFSQVIYMVYYYEWLYIVTLTHVSTLFYQGEGMVSTAYAIYFTLMILSTAMLNKKVWTHSKHWVMYSEQYFTMKIVGSNVLNNYILECTYMYVRLQYW